MNISETDIYGKIYGIKIVNCTNILFKKKYKTEIPNKTIKEARLFYDNLLLQNETNSKIHCKIYVQYTSPDSNYNCMIWLPITLDVFLQKFR